MLFRSHIFFDDQSLHTALASEVVPAARVPYRKKIPCDEAEEELDSS